MKSLFVFLVLLFIPAHQGQQTFNLTVRIEGIRIARGKMSMGLFDSPEHFAEPGKASVDAIVPVKSKSFTYTFRNLPAGTYALAVFHDLNGNDKMDKNFFGIPKEPVGFSNDASGTFGPPDFSDASFRLDKNMTIVIHLK